MDYANKGEVPATLDEIMVSGGDFGAPDVQLFDRGLAEQFAGLLAESGRNRARQVRVAAGVIGNTSKIPKEDGPRRIANHPMVAGSSSTSPRPMPRNSWTSSSSAGSGHRKGLLRWKVVVYLGRV